MMANSEEPQKCLEDVVTLEMVEAGVRSIELNYPELPASMLNSIVETALSAALAELRSDSMLRAIR